MKNKDGSRNLKGGLTVGVLLSLVEHRLLYKVLINYKYTTIYQQAIKLLRHRP